MVYTAILIPMYPARIDVPDPTRKARAVYGKLVGGVLLSLLPISKASTVTPRMMAKTAAKIPR